MAIAAGSTRDPTVIEGNRQPSLGAVARVAGTRGDQVFCRLADSDAAVVALGASSLGNTLVAETRWLPRGGAVATVA